MTKRKVDQQPLQMELGFGVPERLSSDGCLADLETVASRAVAQILKDDPRSRFEVAADVSRLTDTDVSKWMLDAYASPARDGHTISVGRMFALVAATGRYDLLRPLLHRIGCELVEGPDVHLLELGHLKARIRKDQARARMLEGTAEPLKHRRGQP